MILERFRVLALALALTLGAGVAGGWAFAAAPAPPPGAAAEPSREILVLIRAPPQHYRPGGAGGAGYDDSLGQASRRQIAGRLARAHSLTLVTDWPMPLLGVDCFVMAAPAGQSPETAAAGLARDPGVAWAQPMAVYRAQGALPNDPLFRTQPAAGQWRLASLHTISTGRGVAVAVVDSQVELAHPDLAGQVRLSQNFVTGAAPKAERHGTAVAGVIAAREGNGVGIAGVAPGARLLALRACWQGAGPGTPTLCDSLTLAKALHFAIDHGAQVINLSLSGPRDLLLGRLVDVALGRGIAVVAAYDRALPDGGFPASHPGVVAVAETAVEGAPPGVYTAPGRDIPTTEPGGRWGLVDGSSYAAAHVSGLVALARQQPRRAPGRTILVASRPSGGEIDACATLVSAFGRCDCACGRLAQSAPAARR